MRWSSAANHHCWPTKAVNDRQKRDKKGVNCLLNRSDPFYTGSEEIANSIPLC